MLFSREIVYALELRAREAPWLSGESLSGAIVACGRSVPPRARAISMRGLGPGVRIAIDMGHLRA
jgi:hypothetical protein